MIITTEFRVMVVIVAVSACSLLVRPVGIPTLFGYCHRCLSSSSWSNVESAIDIGLLELLLWHFHNA